MAELTILLTVLSSSKWGGEPHREREPRYQRQRHQSQRRDVLDNFQQDPRVINRTRQLLQHARAPYVIDSCIVRQIGHIFV